MPKEEVLDETTEETAKSEETVETPPAKKEEEEQEESVLDDESESSESDDTEEDESDEDDADELAELRAALREERQVNQTLAKEMTNVKRILEEAGLAEPEDPEEARKQQEEAARLADKIETLEAIMKVNPAYADYDQIMTKANQENYLSALASQIAVEQGISVRQADSEVDRLLAKAANPLKFVYDGIKSALKTEDTKVTTKETTKQKEPVNAPPNINRLPGSSESSKGSWTMDRLDNMSDEQLSEVPQDVLKQWEQGALPK